MKAIYLDMDGTIADLYAVEDWLPMLRAYDPTPYKQAKVMHNMSHLARLLNKATAKGIGVGIISWLSKESTSEYDKEVTQAKKEWLRQHLPSVTFAESHFLPYGTPKSAVRAYAKSVLFDDEQRNREEWVSGNSQAKAYTPDQLFEVLRQMVAE